MLKNRVHNRARHINGNGKPDPLIAASAAREYGGVNTDQLAACVDQSSAGVSGIDRCVGLDEVLVVLDIKIAAACRADDP